MALFSSAGRIFFARGAGFRSGVRARIVFFEPLICKRWFNAWGVAKIGFCEFHSRFSMFLVRQNVLFFPDGTHISQILGIFSNKNWFFGDFGAGRPRASFLKDFYGFWVLEAFGSGVCLISCEIHWFPLISLCFHAKFHWFPLISLWFPLISLWFQAKSEDSPKLCDLEFT